MNRLYRGLALGAGSLVLGFSATAGASAQPVEYVRVCDIYGVGWYYIPGTETCVHPDTGETRRQSELGTVYGQTALAAGLAKGLEGVAVTLSIPQASIAPGDRFAVSGAWGNFEGNNAFGFAGAINAGNGLTINGGVGVGLGQGSVGSSLGFNYSWR
jgi:hypothetical protein